MLVIGNKVRLVNTGDEGVLAAFLEDGMVNVQLEDGTTIPVFLDDVIPLNNDGSRNTFIKTKSEEKKYYKSIDNVSESSDKKSTESGLYLAFEPQPRPDGQTAFFDMWIVNNSPYVVVFTLEFGMRNLPSKKSNDHISPYATYSLGPLAFHHLNDGPWFKLDYTSMTTAGEGDRKQSEVKIKAKQFFKRMGKVPLIAKDCHVYYFGSLEGEKESREESLKSYTRKNIKEKPVEKLYYKINNLKEFSAFQNEIDLHIYMLREDFDLLPKKDILRIQLEHFEAFLAKAIELGVRKVFLIHGVGKGKLKGEIHTRLIKNHYVKSFKNEYHVKYGYGATEVDL